MMLADYHVHSTYCDGIDSPREIVLSAIQKGMKRIGFSSHSYTAFDESYCMPKARTHAYRAEIAALQKEFADQITIFCGIEQDYYAAPPQVPYDYAIGSVHYLLLEGKYEPIDESRAIFCRIAQQYFGGDFYALAEAYFETVSHVIEKTNAQIIGHLDLIAKFNADNALFDEGNARYVAAYQRAIDALVPYRVPFELNTGAISRGLRNVPYPNEAMQAYIHQKGGTFILSSDSHSRDALCFGFAACAEKAASYRLVDLTDVLV